MSALTVIVALNAQLLRRVRPPESSDVAFLTES